MRPGDLMLMSLGSLFKRKVRTILTILGVVIGTTSIVVMISLGVGMKASMLSQMESYGSLTAIQVQEGYNNNMGGAQPDSDKQEEQHLDDELVETLRMLPNVASVDPQLQCNAIVKTKGYMTWAQVYGVTPEWMIKQKFPLGQGHIPESKDQLEFVYGNTMITDFSKEKGGGSPYWETGELPPIDLMNDAMFVVFDTDRYWNGGGTDENGQIIPNPKKYVVKTAGVVEGGPDEWNQYSYGIYCNIDALKTVLQKEFKGRTIPGQPTRKNGKPYKEMFYNMIIVSADSMEHVADLQKQINEMGFQTYASAEWIESDMQMMNIVQAVLGGIGGVSLLVAAIGITNTMMMSIYERTKEIGIMKVIGCRIRDIQALFLIEAGYIGLIGGTIGVGLSYILSMVVNHLTQGAEIFGIGGGGGSISVIPLWLSGVAVIFAILIAMLAGFFPSLRAMKLSPLAAIRAE